MEEDDHEEERAPPPPPGAVAPPVAAPVAAPEAAPVVSEPIMPPPPPPVEELMDHDGDELEAPVLIQRESAEKLVAEREKLRELTPMTPITRPSLKQKARALKLAEITRPLSKHTNKLECLKYVLKVPTVY